MSVRLGLGFLVLCFSLSFHGENAEAADGSLPDGWRPVGDGPDAYVVEVSEDAGREGRGLRIKARDRDELRFGGVAQGIAADDYQGERVRLTGYLRPFSVEEHAGLWMRIDSSADQRPLAFDNMMNRPVTGSMDWQQHEVVLDVPEHADHIAFGALLAGRGEVHVDSLNLEIVGDDVAVTEMDMDKDCDKDCED